MLTYHVIQSDVPDMMPPIFGISTDVLYQSLTGLQSAARPGRFFVSPVFRAPNSYHIEVSIGAKTLTLFQNNRVIKTYPIAVGKMLTQTPYGDFYIINRQRNPGGPYGAYWLGLSRPHYGIHGTNNPSSIGKAVSKGCIRMHNKDVIELASIVPNGTRVTINR